MEPGAIPDVGGVADVTFGEAEIGGEIAQVASVGEGTYLVVPHGQPANGGGTYVNQYTLIMDISFPAVDQWISLYQTNSTLPVSGNDGDWFVNPSNGIGIGGNYGGTIVLDTWHRLALVVDLVAGTYTSYIDGVEVQQNTGLGLDGRFSLYTVSDDTPYFVLFADPGRVRVERRLHDLRFGRGGRR